MVKAAASGSHPETAGFELWSRRGPKGVGADRAGALLVAAGDNPERRRSEASFASLCGVSPIPASSDKTNRHRLNRGGDRIANNALWRIVMVRLATDQQTQNNMVRRTHEGRSKREIIRCLMGYVAREVYRALLAPAAHAGLSPRLPSVSPKSRLTKELDKP